MYFKLQSKLELELNLRDPGVTGMSCYVVYTQASSLQLEVSKKIPGAKVTRVQSWADLLFYELLCYILQIFHH